MLWNLVNGCHQLATNILQNIFCVQQKEETHTGLDQYERE